MSDASSPAPASTRLVSLDALRGFAMFWILGSGGLVKALKAFGSAEPAQFFAVELEHVPWAGFHFLDLIFPLFVFIVGVSLVFSLPRTIEREGRGGAARRVLLRAGILYALGLLYYGGLSNGIEGVRWVGVLQRIAIAYLVAGLLFLALRPRELAVACVAILVGYWALLAFVPVPGAGAGNFAERMNLADYLDRLYLPGRRLSGDHDPEGLLSNLPAVATCLLGVFAGLWLRRPGPGARKAQGLAAAGALLLAMGWFWAGWFPVIKKLWTSTYVLEAGGWSALLLGAAYWIIDERGWQRWAQPLVWIGMNPITLYLVASIVDFTKLGARFTGGDLQHYLSATLQPGTGELLTTVAGIILYLLLARFLYDRKIFLRV
jgi:predicted acyltransferase